jgi:hypothetical protein
MSASASQHGLPLASERSLLFVCFLVNSGNAIEFIDELCSSLSLPREA